MKPIKLSLKGLNSYVDKQEIDFRELTHKGIFGVFGDTGSGKSTIIDAITLSLYGYISRKSNDYINNNSNKAKVIFEFEVGSKNYKRRYVVERIFVKHYGQIKTLSAKLQEVLINGNISVISSDLSNINQNIVKIVGLTQTDFTRLITLPQSKFDEFLRLNNRDRREMLERIFDLKDYGSNLINKVKFRKEKKEEELSLILNQINKFNGLSEEVYKNTKKELDLYKLEEVEYIKSIKEQKLAYEENKEILKFQNKLEKYEARFKELDLKNKEISYKESQFKNALNAEKIHPVALNVEELEKRIEEDKYKLEGLDKKIDILNQEITINNNKHEEYYKLKNERLPILKEYKSSLEVALKLQDDIISIDNVLKELKLNISRQEVEKETILKEKNDLENNKEKTNRNIKDLETKLEKLKIDTRLKNKILLAYDYEKNIEKLESTHKVKLDKLNSINAELEDLKIKYQYIKRDKEGVTSKLNDLEEYYKSLISKCPTTIDTLISKLEELSELKYKVKAFNKEENLKNTIQQLLVENSEKMFELKKELNTTINKLESKNKDIRYLQKELKNLESIAMADVLKVKLRDSEPCLVCGSRHHSTSLDKSPNEEIVYVKEKIKTHKEETYVLEDRIKDLSLNLAKFASIDNLKKEELNILKIKLINENIEEIIKKLDIESKIFNRDKRSLNVWYEEKDTVEDKIYALKEQKYYIEKEEVNLSQRLRINSNIAKELSTEIQKEDTLLISKKENYISLKSTIKILDLKGKVEEIKVNEKILEETSTRYRALIHEKENINKSLKKKEEQLHFIEISYLRNKEQYSDKSMAKESKYSKLTNITKGKEARTLLQEVKEEIDKIKTLEINSKEILGIKKDEYEKYLFEKYNTEGRLNNLKENYKTQNKRLIQLLAENKMESVYSIKRNLLDEEYINKLNSEIEDYKNEKRFLVEKISIIKDKLSGKRVDEIEFTSLKNNITILSNKIIERQKGITEKENSLLNIRANLKKLKLLKEKYNNLKLDFDNNEKLYEVLKDNSFIDYLVYGKMKGLSNEASKILNRLTKNKYSLILEENFEFFIKDNINFIKREISTLSGGEIFLVSLSLSISLAMIIKKEKNLSLDLFFLDEGFGRLDNNLLDEVMSSLEELKNEEFNIGIITHVKELRDIVPIKLVVEKDYRFKGSKVFVAYN